MAKGRSLPALLAFLAALACAREQVPPELIGRWTTDDPRYADRALEIGTVRISFGTGPGQRETYFVQGIERESEPELGTLYRLYYDLPGESERTLELRVPQANQLRIENRSQLWTRQHAQKVQSTGG
jgi:hypothetical protein